MRKFFVISIPIITIVLFILIMLSGNFLKRIPMDNITIPGAIDQIINDIEGEKWEDASKKIDQLSTSWDKMVKFVQFSSERDEINLFDADIAKLRGSIIAKDKASSLIELNEAYEHWEELGQ
ncbi:DUF4363 family protein [Clostridium sp. 'White wine YQ']|uniref:DUF4363 family protein n=1 Tax=Clostridium sp. 'White wine YQ' TaxID=3027474 RepID=UPI00236657B3|nr:DUF4363 family protein [Clostridium sp. 'White wine YQ']MDD7794090.1 DUF4363 family protein [Clostridium sp. 'White wine YQ']